MLTSRIVKQVDIPGEEGEWLKLRMLSGKKLEEAREVQVDRQLAIFRKMGREGVEAIKGMTVEQAEATLKADPLAEYDIDVLLRSGILAWSYREEDGTPIKVTPQAIEELDEPVRKWAAGELLRMSLPTEDDSKND